MEEYLRVGVIANTHGVKGEVKVYPTTDDIKRFLDLKEAYLDMGQKGLYPVKVKGVRFFKNLAILKFEGVDSLDDCLPFKGRDLLVTRENAVPLGEDEYFLCDIIGAEVCTEEGEPLGILSEVLETGANDVYVVRRRENDRELLIPVIKDCVRFVDVAGKKVTVRLMPGLTD